MLFSSFTNKFPLASGQQPVSMQTTLKIKLSFFMFLFAVPFWASWIFVFFLLLKMFFQIEAILFDRKGVRYFKRILVQFPGRIIPQNLIRVRCILLASSSNPMALSPRLPFAVSR